MAMAATGQPLPGVVQVSPNLLNPLIPINTSPQSENPSYKSILNPNAVLQEIKTMSAPTFDYHHGEPSFVWADKDIDVMVRQEELHYAVVGKFSYGMQEFQELRKQIPLQCEIKGECSIGFLETRHVIIRLSSLEDYVHLLSRPAFYMKVGQRCYPMRTMKYDVWFDPKEETSIAVAWISFPGLPPVFFVKEAVFALATAVGKPLQLDAATKAKTRPSCAKVKVEVDLLAQRPHRLRIGIKNSASGEIRYKWIRIKYDYIPKFCKECRLQGHNEEDCFVLHPELEQSREDEVNVSNNELVKELPKVLQSGRILGNTNKVERLLVPAKEQRRHGNNFKNFVHPNRNPNAWSKVESKKKQTKDDAKSESDNLVTTNAFALLMNEDDTILKEVASKEQEAGDEDKEPVNDGERFKLVHQPANDDDLIGKVPALIGEAGNFHAANGEDADVEQLRTDYVVQQQPSSNGNAAGMNVNGIWPSTCDAHYQKAKAAAASHKQLNDAAANGDNTTVKKLAALSNAEGLKASKTLEDDEDEEHVQCNGEQTNMLNLKCSMSDDAHALSNALLVPNKDAHDLSFNDKAEENGKHVLSGKELAEHNVHTHVAARAHAEDGNGAASQQNDAAATLSAVSSENDVYTKVSMILSTVKGNFLPNDLIYLNQVGSFGRNKAGNLIYLPNGSNKGFEFLNRKDVTVSLEEEELGEESSAYNSSNVATEGDLSPRPICNNAQKTTREQPSRSTKSQKYKKWMNSKK